MMDFLKKLKIAPQGGEQPKLDLPPVPKDGPPADFRQQVDFPEIKIDAPQFAQKLPDMQGNFPAPPDLQSKGFEELLGSEQSWDEGFDELPGIQPVQTDAKLQPKMDAPPAPQSKSPPKAPSIPPWQAQNMWQTSTPPLHTVVGAEESSRSSDIPGRNNQLFQNSAIDDLKSMSKPAAEWKPQQSAEPQNVPQRLPQFDAEPWRNQQWPKTPDIQLRPEAPVKPSWQGDLVQPDIEQGFVSYSRFQYVVETVNSLVKEAKLAEDTIMRLKEINEDKDEIVSTWQQALEEVEKQLADFDQTLFG